MKKRSTLLPALLLALMGSPVASAEPTADGLYAGFVTTQGTFWCRLEFQRAPRTVANFVSLAEGTRDWVDFPHAGIVRRPFYSGVTFHRVIDGFMIQTGSRNGQGTDGPGYQFADEFHSELKHSKAGMLSMANSGTDSNGSQFFVTVTNTPWLDGKHSVFGEVVEGLDVVFAISKVPTNGDPPEGTNRPLTPVIINEVRLLRRGAAATAFDPAKVVPTLPDVAEVPAALRYTPATTNLTLLLQSRSNHFQHAFFGGDLATWTVQTFTGVVTNINATALLGRPQMFFRVLDGGYER